MLTKQKEEAFIFQSREQHEETCSLCGWVQKEGRAGGSGVENQKDQGQTAKFLLCHVIEQWFSNLSVYQNHLEGYENSDCWVPL